MGNSLTSLQGAMGGGSGLGMDSLRLYIKLGFHVSSFRLVQSSDYGLQVWGSESAEGSGIGDSDRIDSISQAHNGGL